MAEYGVMAQSVDLKPEAYSATGVLLAKTITESMNQILIKASKGLQSFQGGALKFLKPYFENCKGYLLQEIYGFHPNLVLTFGEPAHKLFVGMLDNSSDFGASMQEAFTGEFKKARFSGLEFDYSPCLHIKTFRVAETYGRSVQEFKRGLSDYLEGQN